MSDHGSTIDDPRDAATTNKQFARPDRLRSFVHRLVGDGAWIAGVPRMESAR